MGWWAIKLEWALSGWISLLQGHWLRSFGKYNMKKNICNFAYKHNPTDTARDRKINIYTWHGRIFKEVMILLILQEYIIVNAKKKIWIPYRR